MAVYWIAVPISGHVGYEIEAGSEKEAKEAILNCEGDPVATDYNEDHDTNNWHVLSSDS